MNMEQSFDDTDQKSMTVAKVNGIDKMEVDNEDNIPDNTPKTADTIENSKMNGDDEMSMDSENSRVLENGLNNNPCVDTDMSELQENSGDRDSSERDGSEIASNENSNSSFVEKGLSMSDASEKLESSTGKSKAAYSDESQDRENSMDKLSSGNDEVHADPTDNCDSKTTLNSDAGLDNESSSDILTKDPTVCEENKCNGYDKDSDTGEKSVTKMDTSHEAKDEEKPKKTDSSIDISVKPDVSQEPTKVTKSDEPEVVSVAKNSSTAASLSVPNVPAKSNFVETVGGSTILVPAVASVNSLLIPRMTISGGTHLSSPALAGAIPQPPSLQQQSRNLNNNNNLTPDKAQSSLDMLTSVKKQVEFGSRTPFRKSKLYDPKGELGPTAKFLFNIGQEVVKDRVYSSMIKIQDKRHEAGKLSEKEKKDLEKLKEIHKDVYHNVRDLILDAKSKCFSCNFTSDLNIVLENHKQYPHTNEKGNFCLVCKFTTTTWQELTFHMQLIHNLQPITMKKAANFECSLCPYENNSKNKLFRHKTSCFKNFQIAQNLAPSWLNNDMNFALTDCFYKVPQKKPLPPRPLPLPTRNVTNVPSGAGQTRPTLNIPQQDLKPRPYLYQYVRNQNPSAAQNYRMPVQQNMPVSQTPLIAAGTTVRQNFVPVSVVQGASTPKTVEQILNRNRTSIPPKPQTVISKPIISKPATTYRLTNLAHSKSNTTSAIAPTKTVPSNIAAKTETSSPVQQAPPQQGLAGFVVCEICGGYVKDRPALKVHLFYAHNISLPEAYFNKPTPPLMCEVCSENFWTIQGLQKHRKVRGHTPGTASTPSTQYCSLCGLRNIKNYVGHVLDCHQYELGLMFTNKVCMFPNCSRIFKTVKEGELHMAAYHGILVRATPTGSTSQPAVQAKGVAPTTTTTTTAAPSTPKSTTALPTVSAQSTPVSKPAATTPSSSSNTPGQQGKNQVMVRSNECVFCNTKFANNTDLTKHCLKFHYICNACGMVIRTQQDAIKHLCPNKPKEKKCQICKNIIPIKNYRKHLEEAHLKKCSVKVKRLPEDDVKNLMPDSDDDVSENQEFEDYESGGDENEQIPPKKLPITENSIDSLENDLKTENQGDSTNDKQPSDNEIDEEAKNSAADVGDDEEIGVDANNDVSGESVVSPKSVEKDVCDSTINNDDEQSVRSPRKRKHSQSDDELDVKTSRLDCE